MELTRRGLLGLGLAAAAVVPLAACGSDGGTSPGAAPDGEAGGGSGGKASAWPLTGGIHEILWGEGFERWNEENPDRPFEVEFFANDAFKEKIRTSMGAGTGPTLVFGWGGGTLAAYVASDDVVSLEGKMDQVMERLIPSVVDGGRIDGELYAIPNSQTQPELIYYNKELFEQVGAEFPTTWTELMDVVGTFTEAGIAPFALAGASKWPELIWMQFLTDRMGGHEPFAKAVAQEADAYSDPAFLEAAKKIQVLVEADAFNEGFGSTVADTRADAALVHTGRAAMLLQGSWVYSSFVQDAPDFVSEGKLGFGPFPAIEGGTGDPKNIVGNPSNYWSVNASASEDVQQTGIDFLNTLIFDETYTKTLLDGGGVPPVVGIEDDLAANEQGEFLTFAYSLVQDAPHFTLSWDQALPPDQAQELLVNVDRLFIQEITPEEFVSNMNATLG